jgi:carbonic anhydrase
MDQLEIMQNLVQGVHYFQNIGFERHRELFERLSEGQKPDACFVTCSDSRIDPALITHSDPGNIFVVRNVGNVIPCYGTSNNGELAAVEFAVKELGIRHIIVCGHTGCGAMRALLHPEHIAKEMPSVSSWLRHADAVGEIVREHYSHLSGAAQEDVAAQENVLVQLEHLRTLPIIASRLSNRSINLHGWMYKLTTGEVFRYDSEVNQFLKFGTEVKTM